MLLGILVYAPWAYGCTRWWTKELLTQLLLVAGGFWLFSLVLRRRAPRGPAAALLIGLTLLFLGWFAVFNSLARYDEFSRHFARVVQRLPGLPGSWDAIISARTMLLVTGLLGAFFLSMDFAANPVWRKRLFLTLSLNGAFCLLFGLVQRAMGAPGIYWENSPPGGTFFATYFNHSNAGAFINMTLPLVAGQTMAAFRGDLRQFDRAFWSFLLLASIAAIFVNTSRASLAIGVLELGAIGIVAFRGVRSPRRRLIARPRAIATIIVTVLCAATLILAIGAGRSLKRWDETMDSLFASGNEALWDGRSRIARICWLSIPAAGPLGFGPGTFGAIFPYLEAVHGKGVDGILRYAHHDYLQTAVEWGWAGFLLWAGLIGGGMIHGALVIRSGTGREQRLWRALCLIGLGGTLIHSLVDFPLQIASLQLLSAVVLGQLWAREMEARKVTIADSKMVGAGS